MKRAMRLLAFILVILNLVFLANCKKAEQKVNLKLKFYKGVNGEEAPAESRVVTSYTFKPFFAGNIITTSESPDERKELKEIFHLNDVELLTEADLAWRSSSGKKVFQVINLNGDEYSVFLSPNLDKRASKLRVEVYEGLKEQIEQNLIDAEVVLPRDNIAVIGFSDSKDIPYFLSFHVVDSVLGGVVGGGLLASIRAIDPVCGKKVGKGAGFEEEGRVRASSKYGEETYWFCSEECLEKFKENPEKYVKKEVSEPEENVLRATGDIKLPKLIHKVDPIYPEAARKERIQGVVILEATTDKKGDVIKVKVLRPVHPELDKAAIDAVRQWKYEPMIIDGKSFGLVFTVTVRFRLK